MVIHRCGKIPLSFRFPLRLTEIVGFFRFYLLILSLLSAGRGVFHNRHLIGGLLRKIIET